MRKLILLSLVLFPVCHQCFCQQNNTWYFGLSAGLSFNPGNQTIPYALTNSTMTSFEGSACISDFDGNIILYTNSKSIYNKNHQVILNGDNLLGHESTYQSSLIAPLPNSDHIFYVFTADAYENDFESGYRYSIVDMTRDGGKGEVISKNNLLYAPSTERLTAARHANGVDVWIITNEKSSNIFRVYLLTCNGLQLTPVISTGGMVMDQYVSMNIGALKVSPDGKKLCQTHFPDFAEIYLTNFFQLFSFDNATGVISDPKTIYSLDAGYTSAEFSPDSKLLYLTKPFIGELEQFDVQQSTTGAINASRFRIPAVVGIYGIQLGPDRKVYLNRQTSKLSVINNPNVQGLGCNIQLDGPNLSGRSGGISFPGVINDLPFDPYNNFNYNVLDSCLAIIQFNGFTNLPGPIQWEWDFGDGTTSSLQNPVKDFPEINKLNYVKLRIRSPNSCGYIEKANIIPSSGLFTKAGFNYISFCDSGFVRFNNTSYTFPERNIKYRWEFGDGTISTNASPSHAYGSSGVFDIKLKMNTGLSCLDDSSSAVLNLDKLVIDALPDVIFIDEGEKVQLDVTGQAELYFWNPSIWLDNPFKKNPVAAPLKDTSYVVIAKSSEGCLDSDTVNIKVRNLTDIFLPTAFTPNDDGLNEIFKPKIGLLFELIEFTVYNRWGQIVFKTKTRDHGWDGKINRQLQSAGVYIWTLRALNAEKKVIKKKGTVVLIR